MPILRGRIETAVADETRSRGAAFVRAATQKSRIMTTFDEQDETTEPTMIRPRRLNRDGYENGVSCRVEVCRKRLRSIRTRHTAQIQEDQTVADSASLATGGGAVADLRVVQAGTEGHEEAGLT